MASVRQEPEGGDVLSPAPQSPGRTGRHWRRPLAIALGLIAWPLLAFLVLAATFFLVGLALPPAILRSPPTAEALIITAVLVGIGSLFLHEGTWNGQQLISKEWVIESTAPDPADDRPWRSHQDWKNAGGCYRYMWWGIPRKDGGYAYAAHAHLGQLIAVFAQERVVVVRFGKTDGPVDSWDEVVMAIADRLS